jgi:hypothetical protein
LNAGVAQVACVSKQIFLIQEQCLNVVKGARFLSADEAAKYPETRHIQEMRRTLA